MFHACTCIYTHSHTESKVRACCIGYSGIQLFYFFPFPLMRKLTIIIHLTCEVLSIFLHAEVKNKILSIKNGVFSVF